MALVGLSSGCHVLGKALNVFLPDGRKVSLQFGQLTSRQENILIAPKSGRCGVNVIKPRISRATKESPPTLSRKKGGWYFSRSGISWIFGTYFFFFRNKASPAPPATTTAATSAEFEQMHKMYNELGNAAGVVRRMGRGASTVRKYINMKDCPALVRHTIKELGVSFPVPFIIFVYKSSIFTKTYCVLFFAVVL